MNEQAEKLIRDLADKLGTTAEHLWMVLIHQAPIASAVAILILFAEIFVGIRYVKWLLSLKPVVVDDSGIEMVPPGLGMWLTRVGLWVIAIVIAIDTLSRLNALPLTLAGFFNPEYWALKQIIK